MVKSEKINSKIEWRLLKAIEAKYHANRLYHNYNKLRTIEEQNKHYYENSLTYSIVLSEEVNFIKKTLNASQTVPSQYTTETKTYF